MGQTKGCVIFECQMSNTDDRKFWVRLRGSVEYRQELYKNGSRCVGKMLTVRYQKTGVNDGSLPRFPVGISIRDYE